jgi:Flp pilus assembly protein TadG
MIEAPTAERKRSGDPLAESGVVHVEFALLAPVLLLIMSGIIVFGLVLTQYLMLWNGVGVTAMQFAVSGVASTQPATDAWNALTGAGPALTVSSSCSSGLCMTLSVNGTNCVTNANSLSAAQAADATCSAALQLPSNAGKPAYAAASYPCSLSVLDYNFWPGCQLTAQVTELVQ